MTNRQRIAVIGRGLAGAAAARHLAEASAATVLIGSGEPADYAAASGPFSSHYDQGRITRIASGSAVWAELGARSINRYRDIERRSGVAFHYPRGLVQASSLTEACLANGAERGADARQVDWDWVRTTTGIALRQDHPGTFFWEGPPAGIINPRELVRAQVLLAEQAGASLVESPAQEVRRTARGFEITCASSEQVTADRLVLATGAYGAELVGVDLAIQRRLRTIVLAELGAGTEIPALIDDAPAHPDLDEMYWVPPVLFPDGRTMLKIGGNSLPMITAESNADVDAWFRAGCSVNETKPLQDTVRTLLPDATITSWDHKPCVVTYTEPELPFIGFVDDDVVVALGASGAGAKSSDEIGRLAASLISEGAWTDPVLDQSSFTPLLA